MAPAGLFGRRFLGDDALSSIPRLRLPRASLEGARPCTPAAGLAAAFERLAVPAAASPAGGGGAGRTPSPAASTPNAPAAPADFAFAFATPSAPAGGAGGGMGSPQFLASAPRTRPLAAVFYDSDGSGSPASPMAAAAPTAAAAPAPTPAAAAPAPEEFSFPVSPLTVTARMEPAGWHLPRAQRVLTPAAKVPRELRALQSEGLLPLAGGAGGGTPAAALGCVQQLSPVRVAPHRATPGGGGQAALVASSRGEVLTPVRRCARHATGEPAVPVAALLEGTEWCYAGAGALR